MDVQIVVQINNSSDQRPTRWFAVPSTLTGIETHDPNVLETARGGRVLGYTSGRSRHRLDAKDVACVNMRDWS